MTLIKQRKSFQTLKKKKPSLGPHLVGRWYEKLSWTSKWPPRTSILNLPGSKIHPKSMNFGLILYKILYCFQLNDFSKWCLKLTCRMHHLKSHFKHTSQNPNHDSQSISISYSQAGGFARAIAMTSLLWPWDDYGLAGSTLGLARVLKLIKSLKY